MRAVAVALLLFATAAQGETRTIDGDTIELDGVRVRLFGIDSPERGQPGASDATANLRALIGRRDVTCAQVDYDRRNDRPVSLCSVEGRDLSLAQVRAGHAVVWCHFLKKLRPSLLSTFLQAEREAKQGKRGLWSRPIVPWREWGC